MEGTNPLSVVFMQGEQAEPFPDNWAYLKTELNWLDRVLMLAVARQRKETREIERVAQTRADRVSSHWWKGIVTLDGDIAYDDGNHRKLPQAGLKISYQHQIETRIRASLNRGIFLGLPLLCDRLKLTLFEKNLVLLSLATEVNRRYSRIYGYLQGSESEQASLPTVDLVLRLLCRSDTEWRTARQALATASPLLQHQLLQLTHSDAPLLTRSLKLTDPLVSYLLAEHPEPCTLETLIHPPPTSCFLHCWTPTLPPAITVESTDRENVFGTTLILPPPLLAALQHLCHRVEFCDQVDDVWGFRATGSDGSGGVPSAPMPSMSPGVVALMAGVAGTGKTTAARAIAQTLKTPLFCLDLALIKPADFSTLLQEIFERSPTLLLLKSAHLWLGRNALLSQAEVNQFLSWRRANRGITLLTVRAYSTVRAYWRPQLDQILDFPLPNEADRLKLWQQAFPPQTPLAGDIDWKFLARQFSLSGGEIRAIAREAAFYAAAESSDTKPGMRHLIHAWEQSLKKLKMKN